MDNRESEAGKAFGHLFSLAQRWQTLGDSFLGQWDLTTKQWLLLATIETLHGGSCSLGEAAAAYGSSHQNVKRIARNLERSGFLEFSRDPDDHRVLRLTVTEKNEEFWRQHNPDAQKQINLLFQTLTDPEVREFSRLTEKLNRHTEQILEERREGAS